MDRDVVGGLAQHKTDQCDDMHICESLRLTFVIAH